MKTTDANFKPTPGPWSVNGSHKYWSVSNAQKIEDLGGIVKTLDCDLVSVISECDPLEMQSNAVLIADAGTVYHETGKTPSQLAEENKILLSALEQTMDALNEIAMTKGYSENNHMSCVIARHAIDKAKGL